jgi:hypothetical protein
MNAHAVHNTSHKGGVSMPAVQPATPTLIAIRAAHHAEATPEYDRVVFEFSDPLPLLRIEYVEQLIAGGSGLPVPVAGTAILCVQLEPARAHNDSGQDTVPGRISMHLPLVKEIVGSDDFEAVVTYGIGLSCKAQTRILTLEHPNRLVIDFLL